MNQPTHLAYPDGEHCRAGDIVRYAAGSSGSLKLGRVAAVLEPESALLLSPGLTGAWGEPVRCGEAAFASEGVQRLTCTEVLAVELLFRLLGRQLGREIWGSGDYHYSAECTARVWVLSVAPQAAPESVQRYSFEQPRHRFRKAGELIELPPEPAAPEAGARSVCFQGLRFYEGELLWQEGGAPSTHMAKLERIILPDDEDWQWLYEQEEEGDEDGEASGTAPASPRQREPKIVLAGIDERSGTEIWPVAAFEDEFYGRVSALEQLAADLLFHLVQQHPQAQQRGWATCRDRLSLQQEPGKPYDKGVYWEYQWSQWTFTLAYCSRRDTHIHGYRSFLFDRESCAFTLLEEDCAPVPVCGGGIRQPWWVELWDALLRRFGR